MGDADGKQDSPNGLVMADYEDEVRRRRERGRLSQARFRKKQAQEWQEMRDENRKMKAALLEIVRAAQRRDQPSIIRAVRAGADVVGIDASGLEDGGHEDVADETNATLATSPDPPPPGTVEQTDWTWDGDSSSPPFDLENSTNSPENQEVEVVRSRQCRPTAPTSLSRQSQSICQGSQLDRLRFAVLLSRPLQRMSPPPRPIQYTFVGQLYYACTDYLVSLCHLVMEPYSTTSWFQDYTEPCPSPKEAEDRLWRILQHTPPVNSVCRAMAMAEAHREYLKTVYMEGDYTASIRQVEVQLRRMFEADIVARGHGPGTWMTINGLEGHVRRQLGNEAFLRLERALTCYNASPQQAVDDMPETSLEVRSIIRLLIRNLAESYSCFGDGPCWRVDSVSALFSEMSV